jgi:signal peptidase II
VVVVAGALIAVDQWTKDLIRGSIEMYDFIVPIPAFGDYVLFEHVPNYGAAFGILQGQGWFFITVAALVSVGILIYVYFIPKEETYLRVLLAMQMGGAIGNVIDRLNQGFVTDFVKIGVPGVYYWPNFNVADSSIVVGVILLAIYVIRHDLEMAKAEKLQEQEAVSQDG